MPTLIPALVLVVLGTWSGMTYAVTTTFSTGTTVIGAANTSYEGHDIVVDGAATVLEVNGEHAFASITLTNGAVLTHAVATTATSTKTSISVGGNVTIDAASAIDLSGRGVLATGSTSGTVGSFSGGSYGGLGGTNGYATNAVFGSLTQPVDFGVGGNTTTRGGGSIKLVVSGTLTVDGAIRANGAHTASTSGSTAGGSGGSVWIDAQTLAGAGTIEAKGGAPGTTNNSYSGGGGGRVALYFQSLAGFDPGARVLVGGGAAPGAGGDGSAGTLHMLNTELPPRVSGSSPAMAPVAPGPATNAATSHVDLFFSQKIDAATLTGDDMVVTGPSGAVAVTAVTALNQNNYRVALQQALSEGHWSVTVGPNVSSLAGKLMDQDQDGIEGEGTEDQYIGAFVVDTTAPVSPTVTSHAIAPAVNILALRNVALSGSRAEASSEPGRHSRTPC